MAKIGIISEILLFLDANQHIINTKMKHCLSLTIVALLALPGLISCSKEDQQSTPAIIPMDYTLAENWYNRPSACPHEIDVFYLYPTSTNPACTEIISPVDEYMKQQAKNNYLKGPAGFEDFANVFAPFYRQVSGAGIATCSTPEDLTALDRANEPWADVKAALDEFFTKYNSGRPFILASHSQGTSMMKIVLSEYMTAHPDYYKRMIAAYAIGFRFNKEWVNANSHLKMATGETDTGVIITFEAEGPNNDPCFPILGGTLSINPLNWKTDDTRAGVELNMGSVEVADGVQTKVAGKADATIDLVRGSIIVTTTTDYLPKSSLFGRRSFHLDDFSLFYENIRQNARKRAEIFVGHEIK